MMCGRAYDSRRTQFGTGELRCPLQRLPLVRVSPLLAPLRRRAPPAEERDSLVGKGARPIPPLQQGIQTATHQLSPWATTGVTANTQEGDLLGLNGQPATDAAGSAVQNTPGYNFDFAAAGLLARRTLALRHLGDARSGAALKAEQTFGTGLADNTFNNYWTHPAAAFQQRRLTAAGGIASAATGVECQHRQHRRRRGGGADASIYGNIAKGIGTAGNQLLSAPAVQTWLNGSGGGGESGTWDL